MDTIDWGLLRQADITNDPFLSKAERVRLSQMRFEKRRQEWLRGRLALKLLIRAVMEDGTRLDEIEVENAPGGEPFIRIKGEGMAGRVSLSHSGEYALVAHSHSEGVKLGCDLERVEPRSAEFIQDYFLAAEADWIRERPEKRDLRATLLWSAKESVLKALAVGLSIDTLRVEIGEVELKGEGWRHFSVRTPACEGGVWSGWWQTKGPFVLTLAVCRPAQADLVLSEVELRPLA